MARGRKMNIEDKIAKLNAEIEELKTKINDKTAEIKKLQELQDEENVKELMAIINESGKSFEEVKELIRK